MTSIRNNWTREEIAAAVHAAYDALETGSGTSLPMGHSDSGNVVTFVAKNGGTVGNCFGPAQIEDRRQRDPWILETRYCPHARA